MATDKEKAAAAQAAIDKAKAASPDMAKQHQVSNNVMTLGLGDNRVENAANGLGKEFDKIGETQPVVGAIGKQLTDSWAGGSNIVQGVSNLDGDQIWKGAKQVGKSAFNTLTQIGGLNSMNDPGVKAVMDKSNFGGSAEMGAAKTLRNNAGMSTGMGLVGHGVAKLDNAGAMGMGLANSGVAGQDRALGGLLGTANSQVGSLAQAQQQMANDRMSSQMMAQAASARGGNQAAAMQGAQAQASANGLQTNQQLGLMRLQEEQQRKQDIMGAQNTAAGAYGNRIGTGLNASLDANKSIAGVGTTINKDYLGADVAQDSAQLTADTTRATEQAKIDAEYNKRKQAAKGGILGFAGKTIGGLLG